MLSWILLILIIAIVCTIGFVVSVRIVGRGELLDPMPSLGQTIALNSRAVTEGRYGDVELEVVHRGYRMEQVDALVDQLVHERTGSRVTPQSQAPAQPQSPEIGHRSGRMSVDLDHSESESHRA